MDKAELIWRACGDSSPCKLVVSTPNGKHNYFSTLRDSEKIDVNTLHWKKHPKKDEKWYEQQKLIRSTKDLAQEIDINYTVSAGDPFYEGFSRALHLKKLYLNTEKELILSFDFGFRHPNCSIHQIGVSGEWIIFDNLFGEDETIDEFGEKVKTYLNLKYPNYRYICVGDPAGNQANDKSRQTSIEILAEIGFDIISTASNTPNTNYDARKRIIEKKMRTLIGGAPAMLINDCSNTVIIVEGFEGGYRYADENKYGFTQEVPVKDGYYEHCMNTVEYVAVNFFRPVEPRLPSKQHRVQKPVLISNI